MKTGIIEANLVKLNEEFQLDYIRDLIAQKQTESEKSLLKKTDIEFYEREYQRLQNLLQQSFDDSHLPNESSVKPELNSLLIKIRLTSSYS